MPNNIIRIIVRKLHPAADELSSYKYSVLPNPDTIFVPNLNQMVYRHNWKALV